MAEIRLTEIWSPAKFFTLRAPRRGRARGQNQKKFVFPLFFLEFLAKNSIFEVPRPRRSFLPSEARETYSRPISWRKRVKNLTKVSKIESFWQKTYILQKTKPRDPFQMKDLEISHLFVLWIPLYDQIWPIWWRKRVKNLSKWRFPTVPDSS